MCIEPPAAVNPESERNVTFSEGDAITTTEKFGNDLLYFPTAHVCKSMTSVRRNNLSIQHQTSRGGLRYPPW